MLEKNYNSFLNSYLKTAKFSDVKKGDVVQVQTPSGSSRQYVYDLGFAMPGLQTTIIPITAIGANLTNQPYDALIGRDILKSCTLIYNGWDNSYQLHM